MQVVAIETTIGLFLLERKHTINLSFNLLYFCKVHTNAAARVQIHYTLLCHCPPKSPFQIHFWKCLFSFRVFSCCLWWSGKDSFFSYHSSNTSLPCTALSPAGKTLWIRASLGQNPAAPEPPLLSGVGLRWFILSYGKDFILVLLSHTSGIINAGLGSFAWVRTSGFDTH